MQNGESIEISKAMDGAEKIRRCNLIVDRELLPGLKRYHQRQLTDREKRIIRGHVSMLFMEPCPLEFLASSNLAFSQRLMRRN